jgi:hypothetical protein
MRPLEDELRAALRRHEPPARLAEKVFAALRAEPPTEAFQKRRASRAVHVFRWVAAALATCAIAVALVVQRQREDRRREEACREALLALRIARREVNQALQVALQAGYLGPSAVQIKSSINAKEQP